jgi:hypothetical protein
MADPRSGPLQFARPYELALLRAALAEGPGAAEAVQYWLTFHRDGTGFQGLESGSRRLLPLAYRNAKAFIPSALRGQLRQIQLECWANNQKRFQLLERLLAWFHKNGIPTLVLKGMALSVLHYRDLSVRPTSDFDILVPEEQAPEVIERLQRDGWTTGVYFPSAPKIDYFYRHIHGVAFNHPDYGDLDLHWHVLSHATFPGVDRPFWSDSVPLQVNALTTRALNPTDQLLHACVHGYAANRVSPIRWIADAVTILRTSQINWDRLVKLSRELRVTVPLHATLGFLRASFPTPIPAQAIGELASVRVDAAERDYFDRLARLEIDWREILADNMERHRRANLDRLPILRLASLPRRFQLHYNLPHLKNFGAFAFSRLGRRISKRLGLL